MNIKKIKELIFGRASELTGSQNFSHDFDVMCSLMAEEHPELDASTVEELVIYNIAQLHHDRTLDYLLFNYTDRARQDFVTEKFAA